MEPPIPGVTGELVYRDFQARPGQSVVYIPELGDIAAHLAALVRPGDFVLTMGAGDVRRVGPELLLLLDGKGLPGPARRS
jgi:UDP-N-acetylmuramate--alanine ligase